MNYGNGSLKLVYDTKTIITKNDYQPSYNYDSAHITDRYEDLEEKVELLTMLSYNMYYNNIYNEIINLSDSQSIKNRLIEGLKKLLDTIFKM